MSSVQRHSGLDQAATGWVVRLTSGHANAHDLAEAEKWCGLSRDHRAAFERARYLWRAIGPEVPAPRAADGAVPSTRDAREGLQGSGRSRLGAYAAAAMLVLAVGAAILSVRNDWSADYRTSIGEQRRVSLDDGSAILLDSGGAVDVCYFADRREVHLRAGQALFEVAADRERPFIVRSGSLTATAVGTVYAVRRGDDDTGVGTEVTVQEGTVAVSAPGVKPALLGAGERFGMMAGVMSATTSTVNTQNELAWQRGVLVFELAPLERVVAELNRHRRGYIVIANPELRTRKVSGVFRLQHMDEGLGTLSSAFPMRVTSVTPYLVILR